jgi:hypothetical protein
VALDALLAGRPAEVQEIARRLLTTARDLVPDAVETGEGGDYGVGFGPGYKGLVFVITPQAAGVRLGIAAGASLDDPAGLMQGRGAVHRHVKVTSAEAAGSPELRELMARAAVARSAGGGGAPAP